MHFLGGLIGLECELAGKPAGFRTHMLVASAATLLVILGDTIVARFGSSPYLDTIMAYPIRIKEAIITGISFLGAGTIIFKSQKRVSRDSQPRPLSCSDRASAWPWRSTSLG